MVRLFTTWYEESNAKRRAELASALRANLECERVHQVCVFAEGEHSRAGIPQSPKLDVRVVGSRPSYADFIEWINEVADANDISIIANTDIHFDDSLALVERALSSGQCYALARWDGDELFDRNDSQDAWLFRGQVKRVRGDFHVGVPRCDNRFLHELREAGYDVKNPAFAIRASHVHEGKRAEYARGGASHWVEPPYQYLWPHNLYSLPRVIALNVAGSGPRVRWRIDRRGKLITLPKRIIARIARSVRR